MSQAEFTLVTDYESGMGDAVVSQNDFGNGTVAIVADPWPTNHVYNNVLAINAGDANSNNIRAVTPIPVIPDGGVGTVFLRYAIDSSVSTVNGGIMISPLESPVDWGYNNVILNHSAAGRLQYYTGPSTGFAVLEDPRVDLVWYKAWFVVNTADDTSSLYLQGGAYATPTLLAENVPFRRTDSTTGQEDIKSLLFYYQAGGADPNNLGTIYVDDVYVDTTASNMADPVVAASFPKPSLGIYRAEAAITLDGTKDPSYRSLGRTGWFTGKADNPADLSAELSGTWDDAGIYLFADVTDDVFNQDHAETYLDDSVEFAFDPDNSDHTTNWDGIYDIKVIARRLEDGTTVVVDGTFKQLPPGADFTGLAGSVVLTDKGYAAEVFVPWGALQINPMSDWTLGLGMQVNDDDGNDTSAPFDERGDREGILVWGKSGNYNNDTSLYGDLTILTSKTAVIGPTGSAITIDGVAEGAYTAFASKNVLDRWNNQLVHPEGSATWNATYDEDNLYLFLNVADKHIMAGESVSSWDDDSLELFLDGNNSKSGDFDRVDDVKVSFRLTDLLGGIEIRPSTGAPAEAPAGTDFSGVEAAQTTSESGWTMEIKVPWSVIKFTPAPGAEFGIGVVVDDDDDGGSRDGILTWSGGDGYNRATHRMGTVRLFDLSETIISSTDSAVTVDGGIEEAYDASGWNRINRRAEAIENDNAGYWAATYDSTNLYLLVDVYDDVIVGGAPLSYNDDSIEIFFDPSNNSTGNFDNVEDVKITIASPIEGSFRLFYLAEDQFPDPPVGTDFTGLNAVWVETTLGWRVELQVPWATLRMTPADGHDMGFDIFLIDNDDGTNRDSTLSWSSLGNANNQTQYYGTVYLNSYPPFSAIAGATSTGEMSYDSWMGSFGEYASIGWIWHEGLKWLYTASANPGDVDFHLYSTSLDAWIFVSEELFPYAYVYGTGWVYYDNSDGDAYLYDFIEEGWNVVQ